MSEIRYIQPAGRPKPAPAPAALSVEPVAPPPAHPAGAQPVAAALYPK